VRSRCFPGPSVRRGRQTSRQPSAGLSQPWCGDGVKHNAHLDALPLVLEPEHSEHRIIEGAPRLDHVIVPIDGAVSGIPVETCSNGCVDRILWSRLRNLSIRCARAAALRLSRPAPQRHEGYAALLYAARHRDVAKQPTRECNRSPF
jgi:hypothetical protein